MYSFQNTALFSRAGETDDPSETLGIELTGEGRKYHAYPGSGRVRWLVPSGSREARRGGIGEFFHPRSVKGRMLKAAISSGILPGRRVCLDEDSLHRLEEETKGILPDLESLVFYIGSPGAYRKATALALDGSGNPLAFCKIATSESSLADISAERSTLLRLSEVPALRGRVPEVLGDFRLEDHAVLVLSGGPPGLGPDVISQAHLSFCGDLFAALAEEKVFAGSEMYRRITETLREISRRLPHDTLLLLDDASERLIEGMGSVNVPLSLAHRDFAPWNTRIGPKGLFVFDWDHAACATPLYDLFHFQSIQAALFGRSNHLPDRSSIEALLNHVWPAGERYVPMLYLAYLLDIALLYGKARVSVPDAGDDKVWRWFLRRIEAFVEGGLRV